MSRISGMLTAVAVAAALGACMGRAPQPVAVVQPQDQMMDCTAIYAEVAANNQKVEQLARDSGWKVAQNVAAGVAGFVVPVLWFGMDFQGTADKEAQALQARQQYLGALAVQKHCGGPPRTANRR
jgi:hypothetical protein